MSLYTWHTPDEIAFVKGLGTHVPGTAGDRLGLLRSYDAGMSKRVRWGLINPFEVRVVVAQEIAAEVRQRISHEIADNRARIAAQE